MFLFLQQRAYWTFSAINSFGAIAKRHRVVACASRTHTEATRWCLLLLAIRVHRHLLSYLPLPTRATTTHHSLIAASQQLLSPLLTNRTSLPLISTNRELCIYPTPLRAESSPTPRPFSPPLPAAPSSRPSPAAASPSHDDTASTPSLSAPSSPYSSYGFCSAAAVAREAVATAAAGVVPWGRRTTSLRASHPR